MNFKFALPAIALAAAALTAPAQAVVPVYSDIGTPVATGSQFVASGGVVTAYYLGSISAVYRSELYYTANGGPLTLIGFNTATSNPGDAVVLGDFAAGTDMTFYLKILLPVQLQGTFLSSDQPQVNVDSYTGGDFGIGAGEYTYIAFEDIKGAHDGKYKNDYDYNDVMFAFSNLQNVVPEPATWGMMIVGFGFVGFALRRRKGTIATVSA